MDVDCDHGDYLEIYNGKETSSQLIGSLCGTSSTPVILPPGPNILVKFVTGDITERTGFQLTWQPRGRYK